MVREALSLLETGPLAEIGLIAFLLAFVLILIRVFLMPKKERDELKQQPLDDAQPVEPPYDDTNPKS